ncbi:hypothetical protein R9C00_12630 [Flammeovirgaceae bacterium SG7u.111]|nr:hypothetical protein [Flammeovirgaceae bacterium SG7u.132]WPO38299.1 hypothetical protein R9C00_12630 [Flammeovirgaceae bacterium SG7u.111]
MQRQGFLTQETSNQFKKALGLLVNSNVWIAMNASALVLMSGKVLHIAPKINVLLLVFFSTLADYNLQAIADAKTSFQDKGFRIIGRKHILFLVGVLAILWLCRGFDRYQLLYLAHLAFISVLYAIPTKILDLPPLREIPFLKIFLITYVWVGATAIFPFWSYIDDPKLWALVAERALFIFAITLPFDIRDEKRDLEKMLYTIANQLGATQTRWIAIGCLVASFLVVGVYLKELLLPFTLTYLIAGWLIFKSDRKLDNLYFTGLLDGTMLLQTLLVYCFLVM